jgi:hypothetical protein
MASLSSGQRTLLKAQKLRLKQAGQAEYRKSMEARNLQKQRMDQEKHAAQMAMAAMQLESARRADYNQREQRQRDLDKEFEDETNWRRLMQKASLANKVGKFGAGWGLGDDAWADRLGVKLGYLQPWKRSFTVKSGGK